VVLHFAKAGDLPVVLAIAGIAADAPPEHRKEMDPNMLMEGIVVGCLYAPNGNPQPGPKFDYKLAWLTRLARHARGLFDAGVPVVLAGDYNVVPTPADIYATTSYDDDALVQPQSRAAFKVLLDAGWTDCIRELHPRETIYTFWDYMRKRWERNAGLRIDHLLVNATLRPRVAAAGVDRDVRGHPGASDHAPAWIEIGAAAPRARKRTRG
jgi:exodeoxyribonuclease-3